MTTAPACPTCSHPLLSRRPDRSGPDHGSEGCWGTVTVLGEGRGLSERAVRVRVCGAGAGGGGVREVAR
jgi:hypothetical protein